VPYNEKAGTQLLKEENEKEEGEKGLMERKG
jgi:hypothetical protein